MDVKSSNSRYYAALTGVRALADFVVLFVHYNPISSSAPIGSVANFLKCNMIFYIRIYIFCIEWISDHG